MNEKYLIDTKENIGFLRQLRDELLGFGANFPAPNGGAYYLGADGTPIIERPVETWITCRMAHVYSMGHMLGYSGSDYLAANALKGLEGVLKDEKNGGWYPGITKDGDYLATKQ